MIKISFFQNNAKFLPVDFKIRCFPFKRSSFTHPYWWVWCNRGVTSGHWCVFSLRSGQPNVVVVKYIQKNLLHRADNAKQHSHFFAIFSLIFGLHLVVVVLFPHRQVWWRICDQTSCVRGEELLSAIANDRNASTWKPTRRSTKTSRRKNVPLTYISPPPPWSPSKSWQTNRWGRKAMRAIWGRLWNGWSRVKNVRKM